MAYTVFTAPVLIKSRSHPDAEPQVGHDDPLGRDDVLNRPDKSLTAWVKRLLSSLVSGETFNLSDQVAVTALPVSVVQSASLWTRAGSPALDGAVVTPDAIGSARVRTTSGKTLQPVGVSMFPVGSPAQGAFGHLGVLVIATAGAIVSGNYLVPALTPVGTVEDSGVIHDGWSRPPVGAIGVALANAAVASLIPAYVWGYGYMTGEVTQSAAQAYVASVAVVGNPAAITYATVPGLEITLGTVVGSRLVVSIAGWYAASTTVWVTVSVDGIDQPRMIFAEGPQHVSATMMTGLTTGTHVIAGRIGAAANVTVNDLRLVVRELAF